MRTLCVDDALLILEDTVAMCKKLPEITSVMGFTRPRKRWNGWKIILWIWHCWILICRKSVG